MDDLDVTTAEDLQAAVARLTGTLRLHNDCVDYLKGRIELAAALAEAIESDHAQDHTGMFETCQRETCRSARAWLIREGD